MEDKKPLDINETAKLLGADTVITVTGTAEGLAVYQDRQRKLRTDTMAQAGEEPVNEGLCQKCNTREATLNWAGEGSTLDYSHGFFQRWCELCCCRVELEAARKQAALIPELVDKIKNLEENVCPHCGANLSIEDHETDQCSKCRKELGQKTGQGRNPSK